MQKKILIVGATSGLGRELSRLYAEEGHIVGIMGRRAELLNELRQQFPGTTHALSADINDEKIGEKVADLINAMTGIDILIITASIVEFNPGLVYDPEMKTVGTNVTGFARIVNVAWHIFLQRGQGQIVGVTSIAAARGNKSAPAYHASKAFQSTYLEGLRVKAKHDKNNITITELVPGYMNTAMGKGDRMFWVSPVQKAARQAKRMIERKRSRAFITKRWWFVYHIQRVLPIFIYDWMVNGSWKLKRKH